MSVTRNVTKRSGVVLGYIDYLRIEVNPLPQSVIATLGLWVDEQAKLDGKLPDMTTTYSWSFSELTGDDRTLLSAIVAALDAKVAAINLDNL